MGFGEKGRNVRDYVFQEAVVGARMEDFFPLKGDDLIMSGTERDYYHDIQMQLWEERES